MPQEEAKHVRFAIKYSEQCMIRAQEKEATVSSSMYSQNHRILLVGEGDFSFAAALALLWGDGQFGSKLRHDRVASHSSKVVRGVNVCGEVKSCVEGMSSGINCRADQRKGHKL